MSTSSCNGCITNRKHSSRDSSDDESNERKRRRKQTPISRRYQDDKYLQDPYFNASFVPIYRNIGLPSTLRTDAYQNGSSPKMHAKSQFGSDKRLANEMSPSNSRFSPDVYRSTESDKYSANVKIEEADGNEEVKDESEETERKQNRFSDQQLRTLVDTWLELHQRIEASDSEAWRILTERVNRTTGTEKSLRQIKRKIQVMKQEYKASKNTSVKSGYSRKHCKFFEEMDSFLGTSERGEPTHTTRLPDYILAGSKRKFSPIKMYEGHASIRINENEVDGDNEEEEVQAVKTNATKSTISDSITRAIQAFQRSHAEQMERFMARLEQMEERAQERSNNLILRLTELLRK